MAVLATLAVSLSDKPSIDSLLSGIRWKGNALTYSLRASAPAANSYASDFAEGFAALNQMQQSAARLALARWSAVCNLRFIEVPDEGGGGVLRFGTCSSNVVPTSAAYYPSSAEYGGDVWFGNSNSNAPDNPQAGNYDYLTFIHEIGHALGLKHPHSLRGVFPVASLDSDAMQYTVMSYRSYIGDSTSGGYSNGGTSYATSPMVNDIAAVQYMYGANYNFNSGNTRYVVNPNKATVFATVWDGGGTDTYDLSGFSTGVSIDLRPGQWSFTSSAQLAQLNYYEVAYGYSSTLVRAPGNFCNALLCNEDIRSLIENAVGGSGDDVLIGNQVGNCLQGGLGKDTLTLGDGSDTVLFSRNDGMDLITDDTLLGDKVYISGASIGELRVSATDDQYIVSIDGTGDSVAFQRGLADPALFADATEFFVGNATGAGALFRENTVFYAGISTASDGLVYTDALSGVRAYDLMKNTASFYSVENFDNRENVSGGSVLRGTLGDNVLYAVTGMDIVGQIGDMLWGRSGNDTLVGGTGADTFWYGRDEGDDIVSTAISEADRIMLYTALTTSDVSAAVAGNDLILTLGEGTLTLNGGAALVDGNGGAFILADRTSHNIVYDSNTSQYCLL